MKYFFLIILIFSMAFPYRLTKEEIEDACVAEILELSPQYENKEISCNVLLKDTQSKYLLVATENYTIRVKLNNRNKINSYFLGRVFIYEAGELTEELMLKFKLSIMDQVYHARSGYAKGEKLVKDKFYLKKIDILRSARSYAADDYLFEDNDHLRSGIRADFPLFKWMIRKKPEVIYGEQITVKIIQDNIEFKMGAKVLQEGYVGDKILVQLKKTKKRFKAEIIDKGEYLIRL